jgi:hypothetical protein
MNNPFHDSFENAFRGHRVTATSSNGETYTGVVERLHHHDRHVVLRGAHCGTADDPGAHVGPDGRDRGLINGRNPSGFAATCLYAAAVEAGHLLTQHEAADVAGITPVTLRIEYYDLIEE